MVVRHVSLRRHLRSHAAPLSAPWRGHSTMGQVLNGHDQTIAPILQIRAWRFTATKQPSKARINVCYDGGLPSDSLHLHHDVFGDSKMQRKFLLGHSLESK